MSCLLNIEDNSKIVNIIVLNFCDDPLNQEFKRNSSWLKPQPISSYNSLNVDANNSRLLNMA